jgi:tetratricopeptide (TPR) repeat protein
MNRFITLLVAGLLLLLSSCGTGNQSDRGEASASDTTAVSLELLNKRIQSEPRNADLLHQRAQLLMKRSDFNGALQDIHKALSVGPVKSAYYVTLSDIYLFTGRPDNTKETLIKAVSVDPKDAEARLKLAKLYLIMQDYSNCFLTVKQLLEIDPSNASAYYTRAIALLEKGDTVTAVTDLKKAVENNQEYYEAHVQLGELYAIKKDGLAELYFQNALNIRPQSREALYMLGMFYQETGRYDRAVVVYHNLAKSDTAFREAPYNLGYIHLVYLQDFTKAIGYFTDAIKRDPNFYQAFYNRGYAFELTKNYSKAREDYQKTLKIEVNYQKAIEGLNRLDKSMAN